MHLGTVRGAVMIRPIWIVLALLVLVLLWAALLFGAGFYAVAKLSFGTCGTPEAVTRYQRRRHQADFH